MWGIGEAGACESPFSALKIRHFSVPFLQPLDLHPVNKLRREWDDLKAMVWRCNGGEARGPRAHFGRFSRVMGC